MTKAFRFWIVLVVLIVASPALAQEVEEAAQGFPLEALVVLLVPVIAGILSTFLKSDNAVMKIIDLLAFNWGRARNAEDAQR